MLILYDINHNNKCGLINYKELKVEGEINIEDTLSFQFPITDPKRGLIQEECYIQTQDNEYVIKEVNTVDDDWDEYVCKINIEDIKGKEVSHFETVEQSCQDAVNLALTGTGWTIGSCDVAKLRTVRKNNCTAYDVLTEIQSAYGCEMSFDAINKKVYIYQFMGSDKGVYFAEQLNLKQLQVQRNSYDYITKLIPIGKDGLDITLVNGDVNYIENHQYSDKVIAAYWEDNRYTVAQDLYDDAVIRLDYLSKPLKAYKATIIDLASVSDKYKNIMDYGLGDTITLLSKSKNTKEKQRIVKITIYPEEPEKNTCEIANKRVSLDQLQVRFEDTSDTVDNVTTSDGGVDGSKVDSIDAATQIKNLDSEVARITNLTVINANIIDLQTNKANVNDLSAAVARIGTLETTTAHITNGIIDNATIDVAKVNNLSSTYATIDNLNAATGRITTLESQTASINNLLTGNLSASNMQAGFITADSGLIANAAISSAQIISLDVSKINAGTISTSKFVIQSDSGNMLMSDNTIQIKDANRARVQIGKDASNDYNMYVWDASGNLMFDATGLHADGIKDKIIRDDMVSDTANINAAKLDINSLFSEMNGSTNTLKSSRVYLDTQAQTIDVAFNSLSSTVTSQGNTISSQGTSISTIQGQISSKIWQTDITSAVDGIQSQIDTINTNYSSLTQTVNGIESDVGSLQTTTSDLGSRMTTAESNISQNATDITAKVSTTDFNGNNLVSMINQSSSKINMSALNIDLSGYVTFTNLSTSGQTTIDGGNIKANSLTVDKLASGVGSSLDISSNISITNKVDSSDFASLIQQNPDSVRIAVGQIGGNNLIKNSGFEFDFSGWLKWGTATIDTAQTAVIYQGNKTLWGDLKLGGIGQANIQVKANTDYTFAFKCNVDINTADKRLHVKIIEKNSGNDAILWSVYVTRNDPANLPRYKYTFNTGAYTLISLIFEETDNAEVEFYLDEIKLEEGDNATAWSPNVNELKASNVIISDLGMEIDNGDLTIKDKNNTNVITADGIKLTFVYESSGDVNGWQELGWTDYGGMEARAVGRMVAYIPAGIVITKATLYVDIISRYVSGVPNVTNGYYTTYNIKLWSGASVVHYNYPYASEPTLTGTTSQITGFGAWAPAASSSVQTKTYDVTSLVSSGVRIQFALTGGSDTYATNEEYTDGALCKMTLVVEGFKQG